MTTSRRGRKTKYRKEMAEELPEMFSEGQDVAEVTAKLGITHETFKKWVREKPEFADAYAKGKALSKAWWLTLGRESAKGNVDAPPSYWVFNMKNKFGWRDNPPEEQRDAAPVTINIVAPKDLDD